MTEETLCHDPTANAPDLVLIYLIENNSAGRPDKIVSITLPVTAKCCEAANLQLAS